MTGNKNANDLYATIEHDGVTCMIGRQAHDRINGKPISWLAKPMCWQIAYRAPHDEVGRLQRNNITRKWHVTVPGVNFVIDGVTMDHAPLDTARQAKDLFLLIMKAAGEMPRAEAERLNRGGASQRYTREAISKAKRQGAK